MKETKQRENLKQTLHPCMYILYNYIHFVIVGVRPGQQGEAKSANGNNTGKETVNIKHSLPTNLPKLDEEHLYP